MEVHDPVGEVEGGGRHWGRGRKSLICSQRAAAVCLCLRTCPVLQRCVSDVTPADKCDLGGGGLRDQLECDVMVTDAW